MLCVAIARDRAYGTPMGIAEIKLATETYKKQTDLFHEAVKKQYAEIVTAIYNASKKVIWDALNKITSREQEDQGKILLCIESIYFPRIDQYFNHEEIYCHMTVKYLCADGIRTTEHGKRFEFDSTGLVDELSALLEMTMLLAENEYVEACVYPEIKMEIVCDR